MTRAEWMDDILARQHEQIDDHLRIERGCYTVAKRDTLALIYVWQWCLSDSEKICRSGGNKYYLWDADEIVGVYDSGIWASMKLAELTDRKYGKEW